MAGTRKAPSAIPTEVQEQLENWREEIGDLVDNPAYQRAWAYAASKDNLDKACRIYADSHWQRFEDSDEPVGNAPEAF